MCQLAHPGARGKTSAVSNGVEAAPTASPGLTVAAVARRLGVAPATLRTWDRRYGLGPGTHAPGSHRRYGAADVERLRLMQELVRSGVSVADAAEQARSWSGAEAAGSRAEPAAAGPGPAPADSPPPLPGQEAARLVRGLSAASGAMDAGRCSELIRGSLAERGADWTWDEVLRPVLAALGRAWQRSGTGIEVEHLLSNVARAELAAHAAALGGRRQRVSGDPPPILCACAPDELHDLPMYALAAALADRGRSALVLGARTPTSALHAAIRRTGPEGVVLWACLPVADPAALVAIPPIRPMPRLVLAGPGWPVASVGGEALATDLPGAVTQVLRPA